MKLKMIKTMQKNEFENKWEGVEEENTKNDKQIKTKGIRNLILRAKALIPNWCELGLSNKQNPQQSIDTHTLDRPRTSWVETRTLNYLTTKNSSYQEVATIRYGCSNW